MELTENGGVSADADLDDEEDWDLEDDEKDSKAA